MTAAEQPSSRGSTSDTSCPAAWHLVLGRDGTVLAATGGAPVSWLGRRLEECHEAPSEARDAARRLVDAAPGAASPAAADVPLDSIPAVLHLTLVEALPLRRTRTNLRELLDSALSVMREQASALDVGLTVAVDPAVPPAVQIDAAKISWVITHLVGNALRFVRAGSGLMPGGLIAVRVACDEAAREVAIEVEDNGSGIPADRLPVLFDGEPGRPHAGLGLLMVRDVVAAHGGRIGVSSETEAFGSGTTVRVTLPAW
jgi:signal transduction histidine kinase